MRIVVTGAKGFVGSVFSLRAIERGHQILALDDESRGENPIDQRIGNAYQKFNCDGGILEPVIEHGWDTIDTVVHLAAATGSLDRPIDELLHLNVYMTQRVYEDALRLNAKMFLWPTTSLAIGVPDSPYVESKERALRWLREVDSMTHISKPVRFFNLAGAYKGLTERRKNEVHMLPMMLQAYQKGEPFIVNGDDYETVDGSPSRCFVHILDCVEYLLDIIEGAEVLPHGEAGIYATNQLGENLDHPADGAIWVGHQRPITVLQAVKIFEQFVGRLPIKMGPRRAFDCAGLECAVGQAIQFEAIRGYWIAPTWVTFRDELEALLGDDARATSWRTAQPISDERIEQSASVSVLPQP